MLHHARIPAYVIMLLWMGAAAAGQAGHTQYDRIHFQVRSSTEVTNDRMQALLVAHGEDRDPARLADKINRAMQWALERARERKDVQADSRGYRIVPVYQKQVQQGWRGSQGLQLQSGDFQELAALVGELQTRLQVQSIDFAVSPDRRHEVENRLIGQVLGAFGRRADIISKQLGASGYRIVELDINTGNRPPRPVPMMATRESAASPALAAGTSTLAVTADGVIELTGR